MKVLVYTSKTQGQRKSDYCHNPSFEGKLVRYPSFQCSAKRERVDGRCGCRRGLVSVEPDGVILDSPCYPITTTVMVADIEIGQEEYVEKIKSSLPDTVPFFTVVEMAQSLLEIAAHFPIGAIVEKRGTMWRMRRGPLDNTADIFAEVDDILSGQ